MCSFFINILSCLYYIYIYTIIHCSVPGIRAHASGQLDDCEAGLVAGQNTAFPFRSEHQTGSPHSVTHPQRNLMTSALVIGDSIVQNVKKDTPATTVH